MFEAKEEIREAVDAVYGLASQLQRGEMLPYASISGVLGQDYRTSISRYIVRQARKQIEKDRGISTLAVKNVGIRLLPPLDQLRLPGMRATRAARQVRRGRTSVVRLPSSLLSVNGCRLKAAITENARKLENQIRREGRATVRSIEDRNLVPRRRHVTAVTTLVNELEPVAAEA